MPTLQIAIDKAPANVQAAVRTGGRKIPFTPAGTEKIGDIKVRSAAIQAIGIITDVGAEYKSTGSAKPANPSPVIGAYREDYQMQIEGLVFAPKAAEAFVDSAQVAWNATNNNFEANQQGAHLVVGGYDSGDPYVIVDLNKVPGPVFVPP